MLYEFLSLRNECFRITLIVFAWIMGSSVALIVSYFVGVGVDILGGKIFHNRPSICYETYFAVCVLVRAALGAILIILFVIIMIGLVSAIIGLIYGLQMWI
jgi:hypothetical protein